MKTPANIYILINSLAATLGPDVCQALRIYHAFRRCDFTAAFFRKGKIHPYKLMLRHPEALDRFGMIGDTENSPVEVHL